MAFDNIKPKNMALSDETTEQLLTDLGQYIGAMGQLIYSELQGRIIKEGDADDIVESHVEVTRGGIRPHHQPLVP